jgi:hypothetical protein
MSPRPERPSDAEYYERDRVELFSQGDLFRDVPLAYPLPADELIVDAGAPGSRRFLSGPLEFGPAMLITPSCSLAAQRGSGYSHPVRTLVPVVPLDSLANQGVIKETAVADLRRFDHLINYMYLPPLEVDELEFAMPESVALLAGDAPPRVPRGPACLAARVPRRPAASAEARLVLLWLARGRPRVV